MKMLLKITLIVLAVPVGLLLAFILFTMLNDYRPGPVMPANVTGKGAPLKNDSLAFTVMTWNLGYFGLGRENDFFYDGGKMSKPPEENYRRAAGGALDYLSMQEKADFYFFQEVDFKSGRSYRDNQAELLRVIFPTCQAVEAINYKVPFVPMPPARPMGRVVSGLACFYRFHAAENTRFAFPGGYAWPMYLFMLDRCFILSRVDLPGGKELVLINTHNEAFDSGKQRKAQMALLRETMLAEYEKGNYVIAGGDWNMNPPGFDPGAFTGPDPGKKVLPAIEPDFFPPGWQWVYDPATPTNRDVDHPYTKGLTRTTIIDFFVASPNIKVLEVKTADLGFEWSDHNPVVMKVTF